MSNYKIKNYTKQQAKKLGVTVKPSTNAKKKIDVFKKVKDKKTNKFFLKKIASVGAIGYKDYPTFLAEDGKEKADKRRAAYKKRHAKDRKVVGSPGYYADRLLW